MRCTLMVSTPACHHGQGPTEQPTPEIRWWLYPQMQQAHAPERTHRALTYKRGYNSSRPCHTVPTRLRSAQRPAPGWYYTADARTARWMLPSRQHRTLCSLFT
jgi:hypothetical protein